MKYIFLFLISLAVQNFAFAQNDSKKFTYNIGEMKIIQLNENQGMANKKILIDATPQMLDKAVPDGNIPNAVNAFLVQTANKNILVDTGFGSKLFDNLDNLGVTPEQINIVLLTHMHGDHIGGMLREGKKAFPNAKVYIPEKEYIYWQSNNTKNQIVKDMLSAYNGQFAIFTPGTLTKQNNEILSNIKAIEAYGHTPGHTMFLIDSSDLKLLIWGDLTHALAVQIPFPEVAVTYDVDPEQAIKSRIETLKYITDNDISVAGMHIPHSGMGRVSVDETGQYHFTFIDE